MNKAKYIFLFLIALLTLSSLVLFRSESNPQGGIVDSLDFYCAAGMKLPASAVAEQYEKEFGVKINIIYGGSGTLLNNLEVAQKGDLYLAADYSYINIARQKNLLEESIPVNQLRAGLAVVKGNPKNIKSLQDLIDIPGLKIGLASPDAASVGKFTQKVLQEHGAWKKLEALVKEDGVFTGTVNELANNLKLNSIDVAIVWDAIAAQYPEMDFVHVEEFDEKPKNTTLGILKSSNKPSQALHFARYLTARDKGLLKFKELGYDVVEGDRWTDKPVLNFFGGGMLRPAVEESIREFEKRENVIIKTTFNGCGILVSQMQAGASPDAYFACDLKFMEQVQDRFNTAIDISSNQIVIVVEKGNPKGILSLNDLLKPGIKIGLGHADKSALGYLTMVMLKEQGLYEKIQKNVTVDSPTGDFLVNQISLHSVDAVIIYKSNFMASPSATRECEMIEIPLAEAQATQPYAISKNNENKNLLHRLMIHMTRDQSRFTDIGFEWQATEDDQ